MTPVQLPEVPARRDCVAFRWEGEPINEASDPPWKYASHWSTPPWDHRPIECLYTAAQLREYATEAVMADRRRVRAGVQAAVDSITVPKMTPARAEYWKAGVRYAIRAFNSAITPSETNSGR